MDRGKIVLRCLAYKIKKYFFKNEKMEVNQACDKLKEMTEVKSIEELKLTEEYAIKYNRTTRWQTL